MKNSLVICLIFFVCNAVYCQTESKPAITWSDELEKIPYSHDDFFLIGNTHICLMETDADNSVKLMIFDLYNKLVKTVVLPAQFSEKQLYYFSVSQDTAGNCYFDTKATDFKSARKGIPPIDKVIKLSYPAFTFGFVSGIPKQATIKQELTSGNTTYLGPGNGGLMSGDIVEENILAKVPKPVLDQYNIPANFTKSFNCYLQYTHDMPPTYKIHVYEYIKGFQKTWYRVDQTGQPVNYTTAATISTTYFNSHIIVEGQNAQSGKDYLCLIPRRFIYTNSDRYNSLYSFVSKDHCFVLYNNFRQATSKIDIDKEDNDADGRALAQLTEIDNTGQIVNNTTLFGSGEFGMSLVPALALVKDDMLFFCAYSKQGKKARIGMLKLDQ